MLEELFEALSFVVVTPVAIDTAKKDAEKLLQANGFWTEALGRTSVELVLFDACAAYQEYGQGTRQKPGDICVPMLSLYRVGLAFLGEYDLVRLLLHEYAHAVADIHRGLMRSNAFRLAFDGSHANEAASEFNPRVHISEYASSMPSEDFAECFAVYVARSGKCPFPKRPAFVRRWNFLRQLAEAIQQGRRKW